MTALFGRHVRLVVGGEQLAGPGDPGSLGTKINSEGAQGLRVTFKVEKTSSIRDPNHLELEIHNLSENTRGRLDGDKTPKVPIAIEAGYGEELGRIFSGETVSIGHQRTATGWITKIRAFEGHQFGDISINKSFGPGTRGVDILEGLITDLANGLKLDPKGALAKIKTGDVQGALKTYFRGAHLTGPSDRVLKRLAGDAGLELNLDDGELSLLDADEPLAREAVLLSPTTGLVGSAEVARDQVLTIQGEVKKAEAPGKPNPKATAVPIVKATALLSALLVPGALCVISSAGWSGKLKILHTVTEGDTHGPRWHVDLEGRIL